MTKDEYEAIRERARQLDPSRTPESDGDPDMAMVCVDTKNQNRVVHPDSYGLEVAARFKARCEAFAMASKDRQALVEFIEKNFDIEWPEAKETA